MPHLSQIVLYSPSYFAACAVGGALSCGVTHTALTPIDLLKTNQQANPQLFSQSSPTTLRALYSGLYAPFGFGSGLRALVRGWGPTLLGYSAQGALKFGLYEYYKHQLLARMDPLAAVVYRDLVYVASSAAAEVVADVALCPFEAVKVRVQTSPTYARGLTVSTAAAHSPALQQHSAMRGAASLTHRLCCVVL